MKLNRDQLKILASHMRVSDEVEVLLDDEQVDRLFKDFLDDYEPDSE